MNLNTQDIIKKKLLDIQENVRDFETYSKAINEPDVKDAFKEFAEQCGFQASRLQELNDRYSNDSN